MNKTILRFNQELYPKAAVMKAAYHFIDRCYVHVDIDENDYVIDITCKSENDVEGLPLEFENELLAQAVRYQVYLQTHTLREILLARALSSTITGSETALMDETLPEGIDNLESILTDWFEKNE